METSSQEEKVRGTVERIKYRNPENGYSVLEIRINGGNRVTVVGNCADLQVDADIEARGIYQTHARFGRQLAATTITVIGPTSPAGIERYLSSGLVRGVGRSTAKKIVEALGEETLEVIYKDPERLAGIPGVGKRRAKLIAHAFAGHSSLQEIIRFLVEHHVSPNLAQKIYKQYGERAVQLLKSDPYILAREMRGVGFKKADAIALDGLKLSRDAAQRLRAGLVYTLEKAAEDGHCYLPSSVLITRAYKLLDLPETIDLTTHLHALAEAGIFIKKDDAFYLPPLFRAEDFIARFVAGRSEAQDTPFLPEEEVRVSLELAEEALGIEFSEEQKQAVVDATRYRLLLITGGPGCGKTTLIRALSLLFRQSGRYLVLAAPTGRAAQRMAQVCDFPASTIHRLLKFSNGQFLHGINEPLTMDALIVDEASMIDVPLASALFSALPPRTVLILVGDKDQLPSVGPGRLFGDLVSLSSVKTIKLTHLFRRGLESFITTVAHTINSGEEPDIPEPDGVTKTDAYFLSKPDPQDAVRTIERLVADQVPRKFDIAPNDIMVLTPSNRGPLGTVLLNQRLQERINPLGIRGPEEQIVIGETIFRTGDRVCQRVNNYSIDDAGVYNGDTGTIMSIDAKERSLIVELWDGRHIEYRPSEVGQLALAYAMTVHRSQGSEIPCVVLALHESHFALLERQLIYTAVTRAKRLLIVVGSRKAMNMASKRASTAERCTMLKERIAQYSL